MTADTTTHGTPVGPAPGASIDARRAHVHGMWSAVAASWAEYADFTDARHAEIARTLLDLTSPQTGERVLELACGAGGLGLAAAFRVGLDGVVVLSDVAPEMTAIAAQRAAAAGAANVQTRLLDLERVAEPDGSYDVVLCRDGMQFAFDPAAAALEVHRLLRPGGRFAVAVWGPRERNPWLGLVFDAVAALLGRPVPPPGVPGPFSLSDPTALAALFRTAALADVHVRELNIPLHAPNFDQWWRTTSALAGPLAGVLAGLPDSARAVLVDHLHTAVLPYVSPTGSVDLPGLGLIASGRRL